MTIRGYKNCPVCNMQWPNLAIVCACGYFFQAQNPQRQIQNRWISTIYKSTISVLLFVTLFFVCIKIGWKDNTSTTQPALYHNSTSSILNRVAINPFQHSQKPVEIMNQTIPLQSDVPEVLRLWGNPCAYKPYPDSPQLFYRGTNGILRLTFTEGRLKESSYMKHLQIPQD